MFGELFKEEIIKEYKQGIKTLQEINNIKKESSAVDVISASIYNEIVKDNKPILKMLVGEDVNDDEIKQAIYETCLKFSTEFDTSKITSISR